jgi:hypothetical protein
LPDHGARLVDDLLPGDGHRRPRARFQGARELAHVVGADLVIVREEDEVLARRLRDELVEVGRDGDGGGVLAEAEGPGVVGRHEIPHLRPVHPVVGDEQIESGVVLLLNDSQNMRQVVEPLVHRDAYRDKLDHGRSLAA